jgi:hypothetical protein
MRPFQPRAKPSGGAICSMAAPAPKKAANNTARAARCVAT